MSARARRKPSWAKHPVLVTERQHAIWVRQDPYGCANWAVRGDHRERCALDHLHGGECMTRKEWLAEEERQAREYLAKIDRGLEQIQEGVREHMASIGRGAAKPESDGS